MAFDYTFMKDVVNSLDIGLKGQLVIIAIIAVSCLAITRNTKHVMMLMFPMTIGYSRLGLDVHFITMSATGILWATTLVDTSTLGGMLQSVQSVAGYIKERVPEATRVARMKAEEKIRDFYEAREPIRTREGVGAWGSATQQMKGKSILDKYRESRKFLRENPQSPTARAIRKEEHKKVRRKMEEQGIELLKEKYAPKEYGQLSIPKRPKFKVTTGDTPGVFRTEEEKKEWEEDLKKRKWLKKIKPY